MTTRQSSRQKGPKADVRQQIHDALARVRALDLSDLQRDIEANKGDLEIDSKEAEVVISMLEVHMNRDLVKVEDLRPDQLATIEALVSLITSTIAA